MFQTNPANSAEATTRLMETSASLSVAPRRSALLRVAPRLKFETRKFRGTNYERTLYRSDRSRSRFPYRGAISEPD